VRTWSGWVKDFIGGLGIPDTAADFDFLAQWSASDAGGCNNNPVLASHKEAGSTNCQRLNSLNTAQAYDSHADAIAATKAQLNSGAYPNLHDALHSGDPYGYPNPNGVALDLQKWGTTGASQWYADKTGAGQGVGGTPSTGHVTQAWSRWMHALAHKGPDSHRRIVKATARARRIAR
jgi:hypothetical protein